MIQSNKIMRLIEKDGIDFVAKRFSEIISGKISSQDIAIQLVLEDLDAASNGNTMSKDFVLNSGFCPYEYENAKRNTFEEIDDAQEQLGNLSMLLHSNEDLMIEFRIKVIDNIMARWKIGKYSSFHIEESLWDVIEKLKETNNQEPFYDIYIDLENYISQIDDSENNHILHMSAMYAIKISASALFLQGLFGSEEYQQIDENFKFMQSITEMETEMMLKSLDMAFEFIKTYNDSIDKELMLKLMSIMDNNIANSPKENGEAYSFIQLMSKYSITSGDSFTN